MPRKASQPRRVAAGAAPGAYLPLDSASWPANGVERRPIGALTPFVGNARTHSTEQVDAIAASIREWGWTIPVLIDETGSIIAGHARVQAAQRLGLAEVPVMVARGWSEAKRRAYVLADNKLAENSGWDLDVLAVELIALRDIGFDLSLTGFSDVDVRTIFARGQAALTDPDDVPEVPAVPLSRLGDVWVLGSHRLVCGDCTDAAVVENVLAGAKPHLMVTDPPYGVSYSAGWRNEAMPAKNDPHRWKDGAGRPTGAVENDDRADWREAWALFPGDVAYVWHGALQTAVVLESLASCGLLGRGLIIWAKHQAVIGRGDYHNQHEPLWYTVRKGATGHWAGGRKQTTVWNIDKPLKSETGHSTQKPVECMQRPIENNSAAGDAVYEPFSGSGTTIIAAQITGRACHAIELNPAYVDLAVIRWQEFTGEAATLEGDGRTFAEIAEAGREASAA